MIPKCPHCPVPDGLNCPAITTGHRRFCQLMAMGRLDYRPVLVAMARGEVHRPLPATPTPVVIPPGTVVIHTFLSSWSGYGRFGEGLGRGLESVGIPVLYEPIAYDEQWLPVGEFQRSRAITQAPPDTWRLQIHFPTQPVPAERPTACYTMFEASEPPKAWIDNLNRAKAVIFPCHWCLDCFKIAGLTAPSFVVPGGVDTAVFHPSPGKNNDICRFGMAMRLAHGGCRKGLHEGIAAFLAAFPPKVQDVRLHIKLYPDCETGPLPDDPRIVILRDPMGPASMASWYWNLDALFVSSKAEGFGLHSLEALACGVPIIAAIETGTAEFATEACCYPLEGRWEPAGGWYRNQGNWYVPSVYSMIEQLRRVYRNRDEARAKGEMGAKRAMEFTWQKSGRELRKVLESVGMLAPKPRIALGQPHCVPCVETKKEGL